MQSILSTFSTRRMATGKKTCGGQTIRTNTTRTQNQLTHQEEFSDKINKWNFVFDTNDNNRIGKYLDNQRTDFAKPQRLNESSIYLIIE